MSSVAAAIAPLRHEFRSARIDAMSLELRFECQPGCTECCTQRGFVYLTEADVERAAAFLKMTPGAFEQKYIYRSKHLRRLRISQETRCFFLKDGGCSIHEVKPTQCRIFPNWPELIESKREWQKAAKYCPGIGKGPLIQIEMAKAQAEEMRQGYPQLY
jgi:Fe-S-cluster containining protein